jgi:ABC-2 type transport system permease protein
VRSQIGASQVALLVTLLPTSLLSGYTFPIDQMPAPVQVITYLVPSRYYVTIVKAIFLKGAGIIELALPITLLSLYALVIGTLAARAFRKRLD